MRLGGVPDFFGTPPFFVGIAGIAGLVGRTGLAGLFCCSRLSRLSCPGQLQDNADTVRIVRDSTRTGQYVGIPLRILRDGGGCAADAPGVHPYGTLTGRR